MGFSVLLFDLDGTIVDSGEGIMKCAEYALSHFGIEENWENLRKFVGPPLEDSFVEFYGFTHEKAEEAVAVFRERYYRKGIYEQKLYPGVVEFLKELKSLGYTTAIATSKMQKQAERVVSEIFPELYPCFDYVFARDMEGIRHSKADVIDHALKTLEIKNLDSVLMIGDRKYDIEGAKACGLASLGVSFGYGGREELVKSGADLIVDSYGQVISLLGNIENH